MIIDSSGTDVYSHLAYEEILMEEVSGPVLMLWQSNCAVVIGKNQNPWVECRLKSMELDGVPLARRCSGGGTVYHDEGNLNYCIITDREKYKQADAFKVLLRALKEVDVNASIACKSNIVVDNKKISGTAFAFRKNRVLHHGTLLLNTDLSKLDKYLGSDFSSIKTNAVASVPAKVTNINISINEMKTAFCSAFKQQYGFNRDVINLNENLIKERLKKIKSDSWIWGNTPRFSIEYNGRVIDVNKNLPLNAINIRPYIYNIDKFFTH